MIFVEMVFVMRRVKWCIGDIKLNIKVFLILKVVRLESFSCQKLIQKEGLNIEVERRFKEGNLSLRESRINGSNVEFVVVQFFGFGKSWSIEKNEIGV